MRRGRVLVGLGLGLGLGCGVRTPAPARAPAAARTGVVQRGQIVPRVLLTGRLDASSSALLVVPQTGVWNLALRWVAEDGAQVKAGDRVAELDNSQFTSNLEQKHLSAQEAEMTSRTAHDLSVLDLADKQAALDQAQIAFDKANLLASVPADLLPARDAQQRQLDKAKAQIALDKAKDVLAAAKQESALEDQVKQIELDKANAAVDTAEQTIKSLVLRAPRDGIVVIGTSWEDGGKFHIGDTVEPGMTIATLPDLSQPMQVLAVLSDVDDGLVAVGMAGTCTLDAYPGEPIACTVTDLAPVARARTAEGGQKSLRRSFAVVLSLGKTDPTRMWPGMSVKVELHRPAIAALVVPRGAVLFGGDATRVRLAGGALRDVTLGACDAQACAVEKGLADGDRVALGGGS